jgi:2-keto-3-deoxy-L-rhamnonate aldolase RhmA
MMRPNPLKAIGEAGRPQIGTWINLVRNPAVLTLLQSSGLDYARVDMEHSSPSVETIADMALLSRALGFPLVVRPPAANREWVTRLLDLGVWGLHVPQVDTPEIAREVVAAALYAPAGMRGMAVNGPHNDYRADTGLDELNAQVHITVMLESRQAFEHLDEIVATPGIDAVTLGPADLAQELGVRGRPDEARVVDEHREALIAAARRHGQDVAMLFGTVGEARRWLDAGVRLIAVASDVEVLQQGYRGIVTGVRGDAPAVGTGPDGGREYGRARPTL